MTGGCVLCVGQCGFLSCQRIAFPTCSRQKQVEHIADAKLAAVAWHVAVCQLLLGSR